MLLGGGWFAAKLMCEAGCQSFEAIFVAKGRERRELMVGTMARALGTARDPEGGQKSSWTSTIKSAGLKSDGGCAAILKLW